MLKKGVYFGLFCIVLLLSIIHFSFAEIDLNSITQEDIDRYMQLQNKAQNTGIDINSNEIIEPTMIIVSEIIQSPSKFQAGESGSVIIKVKNLAEQSLSNVEIKLNLIESSFNPTSSGYTKIIEYIGPKEEKSLIYDIIVSGDGISGIHSIPITITYKLNEQKIVFNDYISLLIDSYSNVDILSSDNSYLIPNKKNTIKFTVANSGNGDMSSLKLSLIENELYTILSDKIIYIGDIKQGDYRLITFDIYPNPKIPKQYPFTFQLEYKDAFNKENKNIIISNPIIVYSKRQAVSFGLENFSKNGLIIIFFFFILLILISVILYERKKQTHIDSIFKEK